MSAISNLSKLVFILLRYHSLTNTMSSLKPLYPSKFTSSYFVGQLPLIFFQSLSIYASFFVAKMCHGRIALNFHLFEYSAVKARKSLGCLQELA